jgi:hypothetical protein
VATHGWTRPRGDCVGPHVVEERAGSAALASGSSANLAALVLVAPTTTPSATTRGGRGTRAPEWRDCGPLKAAKAVA